MGLKGEATRLKTKNISATIVADVKRFCYQIKRTTFSVHTGIPAHIRSDNGPEFVAKTVQEWIAAAGAKTAYIERGSPWENCYIESFNARLRDELLNGEIFYALREAQIVIESWRRHYNTTRPHASIGYKPPAPEGIHARIRRVAGCATPTGSADHAGATANLKLTFHPDHSVGADQSIVATCYTMDRVKR